MRSKIPNGCRKHVLAGMEKGSEIVRFVPPMRQVASTRPVACTLLIYVKEKLAIGAHIYVKMLWRLGKFDHLFEVKHDFISLWGIRGGNPLCVPIFTFAVRRSL